MMAFQAGGPHAQDRGLEAVAYAWDELSRVPSSAQWEKPQGKNEPIRMEKRFRVVPRGVGLVIGCCTFPTWNGYPGLFASLATGNAVIVKPHPGAILPARDHRAHRARSARGGRHRPQRRDAVRARGRQPVAQQLALRPEVRIIDFTGSTRERPLARGACAPGAGVHREGGREPDHRRQRGRHEGGRAQRRVLAVAVHGTDVHRAAEHLRPARRHRHRRRPPVVRPGRRGAGRRRAQAARPIPRARSKCWAPCRTTACCAGSRPRARSARSCSTRSRSRIPRSRTRRCARRSSSSSRTADRATYLNEWFGPIAFVIATADTNESLAIARDAVRGARRAHAVGVFDQGRGDRSAPSRSRRMRASRCRSISRAASS